MTQSSYLMSFIRSLMEHSSKDIREKKKLQLETDFTETGTVLNTCLTEKFEDVTKFLNIYNQVSERVSANMAAVSKIKSDLIECKSLLHCNREELRRLWLELVEQRHCIELLDILDQLQAAPDAIATLVSARAWPDATELMLYTTELLKSDIASVPALQTVKADLAHKNKFIVDHLQKQLRSLIYERPLALVVEKYLKRLKKPGTGGLFSANNKSQNTEKSSLLSRAIDPARFATLPLASWHTASVVQPTADPNLRKNPQSVSAAIAARAAAATDGGGMDQTLPKRTAQSSEAEWIRELVAITHCLAQLDRLPQILNAWCPQSHLAQLQHAISAPQKTDVFSGPLIPGQGLLGEIHRFIVLKAVSVVESKAISQGDVKLLSEIASPGYLVDLLQLVFDSLFMQSRACQLVIRTMNVANVFKNRSLRDLEGLSGDYVWSCIQREIELVLSVHLNEQSSDQVAGNPMTASTTSAVSTTVGSVDISRLDLNSLMGRRRAGPFNLASAASIATPSFRPDSVAGPTTSGGSGIVGAGDVKSPSVELFSFSNTSHFLSVNSYMREHRLFTETDVSTSPNDASASEASYPLVCRPSYDNITSVYRQVMEFVAAAENEMNIDENHTENTSPTSVKRLSLLRMYLMNFIDTTFLPGALSALRRKLQRSLSAPDSLNSVVSQQVERELGLNRPILMTALCVDECLVEIKRMFLALPDYSDGVMRIGTSLLNEFIGAMWRVYRSLSEVDKSGTTVPSSDWAQDNDVSRFWKKFPVWLRMAAHEARIVANTTLMTSQRDSWALLGGMVDSAQRNEKADTGDNDAARRISPATIVTLGLANDYDGSAGCAESQLTTRLVIPFAMERRSGPSETEDAKDNTSDFTHLPGLLHEREATRLAAKETKQLLHMIKDELPESQQPTQHKGVYQLPVVRNIQILKILGRLSESLCWLAHRVLGLDTWLRQLRRRMVQQHHLTEASSDGDSSKTPVTTFLDTPFAACSRELTRVADACLLMVYLEVRIQAYNHFGGLPENVNYSCPVDDVDADKYVTDFLVYLERVQDLLMHTFSRHKFRFIFDGLGDFISQLLLRLVPTIPRMNRNGNRKMCRNVYRLQQALASLTETHESDLIRVKQLFELFHLTPETVVNRLMEQGAAFEETVYRNLLELYQRSHPTHSYTKTQESIAKLSSVIKRTAA
ncbi:Exocyst complex component 4 [Clonorchis sinensis]|uniref:Exocyst complex component Sec8 n=1 Tax=Clonorchis sinensis TaxID=79923 RepID=A0A3R7G861_CLOSI|nr:Exocyst complex component 4 [Clonorchis sinensis]